MVVMSIVDDIAATAVAVIGCCCGCSCGIAAITIDSCLHFMVLYKILTKEENHASEVKTELV